LLTWVELVGAGFGSTVGEAAGEAYMGGRGRGASGEMVMGGLEPPHAAARSTRMTTRFDRIGGPFMPAMLGWMGNGPTTLA
jgi:hypothetical protein